MRFIRWELFFERSICYLLFFGDYFNWGTSPLFENSRAAVFLKLAKRVGGGLWMALKFGRHWFWLSSRRRTPLRLDAAVAWIAGLNAPAVPFSNLVRDDYLDFAGAFLL